MEQLFYALSITGLLVAHTLLIFLALQSSASKVYDLQDRIRSLEKKLGELEDEMDTIYQPRDDDDCDDLDTDLDLFDREFREDHLD